ncbi:MAG TPA: hypothetical protein VFY06_02755 [Verrucomicrobiae bacterium]|nr:hypothetical protein [Verrucomicrobiae bacterium]
MRGKSLNPAIKIVLAGASLLPALVCCVSCRTAGPLPAADLSAPGWRVLQGQAVWKPAANRPELAGDLLLATNMNGNFFVQLTKDPFPLATAESVDGQWAIEFGADEHSWRGRGRPPERFVWFQLPRALLDKTIANNWHFENVATNSWRLENRHTGETLEGGFFP